MSNAFENLKTLLIKNGYGRVINTLNKQQTINMIRDEVLTDSIDINKPFIDNQKLIYDSFYDKNWVSIYTIFSEEDIKDMYNCVQQLLKD
jgi:hypothetical protein